MSDLRSRELEKRARGYQTPDHVANFLEAKIREDAPDLELSRILGTFLPDLRGAALKLIVDLPEDRQVLLEAMAMLEDQIGDALQYTIQPREGDAPLPTREAILQSIHRTLTPEQARVILDENEILEPTLLLVPVTSTDRYSEALWEASQIMEESREPYLSRLAQDQLNALTDQAEVEGNKVKKWKFAITEGAQTFCLPDWDNGQETHQHRIVRFNGRFAKSGMTRLECQSYIALMIQSLRQGKPIDCEYLNHSRKADALFEWQYTLLNEMDEEGGRVSVGYWVDVNRSVYLDDSNLDNQNFAARFRPGVVGDIEI